MGFEVKKNKGEKPEEKKREKKDKGCRMNNFDATTHRKPPLKKRKRILSEEESQYHKLKTQQATHIKISSPRSPLLLVYTCNIYIYTYMFNLFKKKRICICVPVIFKVILLSLEKTTVLISEKNHPALQNTLGKNRNTTVSRMDPKWWFNGDEFPHRQSVQKITNPKPNEPKKCCGHKNSQLGGFNQPIWKNMLVNLDHFPKHHPEILYPPVYIIQGLP